MLGLVVGVLARIIYVYLTKRYSRPQRLPVEKRFIARCKECKKIIPEWSFVCPVCFAEENDGFIRGSIFWEELKQYNEGEYDA
tara:strand:- start:5874 stop:6122 length:249 start_codon:yes stop_codon:yes gene_type:complete